MIADDLHLVMDHLLADVDQVGDGDVLLDAIALAEEPALADAGQVQDGFAQRLRGNRAGVDGRAAETLFFSMIATFLPSLAAWMAAFCPAGPVPITTQSN